MSIFHGFVIFCLFAGTSGDLAFSQPSVGFSCPTVPALSEFNQTKFGGTWFKNGHFINRDSNELECTTLNWTALQNREFSVVETYYAQSTQQYIGGEMIARVPDSSKPAQFRMSLVDGDRSLDYWILKTDYISYAVAYICQTFSSMNEKIIRLKTSILTREQHPPRTVIEEAMKFIKAQGLNISDYMEHNQTNCKTLDEVLVLINLQNVQSQEITTNSSSAVETEREERK